MKIRTDFVTNSSSTSFVIITSEELTLERFLALMGIEHSSPFVYIFQTLYESLGIGARVTGRYLARQSDIESRLLPHVKERIKEARQRGERVFIGELSSEENTIESFFCTESFEIEENGFFFSALENYW